MGYVPLTCPIYAPFILGKDFRFFVFSFLFVISIEYYAILSTSCKHQLVDNFNLMGYNVDNKIDLNRNIME